MDVINAIRFYLEKIVSDPTLEGMKVLLLDAETTKYVSMVYTQSQILEKEVFLVEELGTTHERMTHMKAAVFIRPTSANIENLKKEIKDPKYGEYHVFFSNILSQDMLDRLAAADELEVIRQVQEFYADYMAINHDLFHLRLSNSLQLSLPRDTRVMPPQLATVFNRTLEGVLSVFLSLKKKPVIRFQHGSAIGKQLATEISSRMQRDGLFDFRRPDVSPVLLILDRREDPVTPLLTQWTYQAMVHEILGLYENRVDLSSAPGVRPDLQDLVLSVTSDAFFEKHIVANFGDLGMAVKGLVDEYQSKAKTHENIESIEDMQRFVENYPAFRSQSLNVSKHVALMGELARLVEVQSLMDVSQLEQELSTNEEHSTHYRELTEKLNSGKLQPMNKLRLAMLYALRYETSSSNQIAQVKSMLQNSGIPSQQVRKLDTLLEYGGATVRSCDLYGDRGLKKYMRAMTQGLQGVPNVYAQHVPPLVRTIDLLMKGQLPENTFPTTNGTSSSLKEKTKEVIVFISGGVTFEEAAKVHELNKKYQASGTGQRIILGGSCLLNSKVFLSELESIMKNSASKHGSLSERSAQQWNYDSKRN